MKILGASLVLASALVCVGSRAATAAEAQTLVTVELFTSQGCSSCPVADQILTELADRPDVLALTLPVDYWDYLGWRDTLARPEHTKRQYAYAKALKTYQPYTPQVVIDGRVDVVGNDKTKIKWAIEDRRKRDQDQPPVPIGFDPGPDSVVVVLGGGAPASATVWLVRYAEHVSVKVDRGENEGHMLSYSHVVESMAPIGMWTGAAERFVLPRGDLMGTGAAAAPHGFAVIVQKENTGPIIGAARLPAD